MYSYLLSGCGSQSINKTPDGPWRDWWERVAIYTYYSTAYDNGVYWFTSVLFKRRGLTLSQDDAERQLLLTFFAAGTRHPLSPLLHGGRIKATEPAASRGKYVDEVYRRADYYHRWSYSLAGSEKPATPSRQLRR